MANPFLLAEFNISLQINNLSPSFSLLSPGNLLPSLHLSLFLSLSSSGTSRVFLLLCCHCSLLLGSSNKEDWDRKKKTPPSCSSIHPHTCCITTQLHLDYINVLSPSQASSAWAKPILHRRRCLCGALWRRIILWYCVRINIKSHYGCGGSREREGW